MRLLVLLLAVAVCAAELAVMQQQRETMLRIVQRDNNNNNNNGGDDVAAESATDNTAVSTPRTNGRLQRRQRASAAAISQKSAQARHLARIRHQLHKITSSVAHDAAVVASTAQHQQLPEAPGIQHTSDGSIHYHFDGHRSGEHASANNEDDEMDDQEDDDDDGGDTTTDVFNHADSQSNFVKDLAWILPLCAFGTLGLILFIVWRKGGFQSYFFRVGVHTLGRSGRRR